MDDNYYFVMTQKSKEQIRYKGYSPCQNFSLVKRPYSNNELSENGYIEFCKWRQRISLQEDPGSKGLGQYEPAGPPRYGKMRIPSPVAPAAIKRFAAFIRVCSRCK